MRLFRIAYKDLKASKHFLLFFLLNLSLGLFGLVLVQSFKSSFSQALTSKSRELLGADLSIEGRNKLSPTQRTLIENKLKPIQTIDSISLFAMLSAKNKSHLVYLTQHEKGFPFYGEILLKKTGSIKEKNLSDGEIWVYPELLLQFGVEIGDVVKIGEGNFRIAGVVEEDTTQGFQMGSAASRVIISNTGIKKASLLKKGSTAFYKTFFKTILPIEQRLE